MEQGINTLCWHDASTEKPVRDSSSKVVLYYNREIKKLEWGQAYFNGLDWLQHYKIDLDGELHVDATIVLENVRFWSDFPTTRIE